MAEASKMRTEVTEPHQGTGIHAIGIDAVGTWTTLATDYRARVDQGACRIHGTEGPAPRSRETGSFGIVCECRCIPRHCRYACAGVLSATIVGWTEGMCDW